MKLGLSEVQYKRFFQLLAGKAQILNEIQYCFRNASGMIMTASIAAHSRAITCKFYEDLNHLIKKVGITAEEDLDVLNVDEIFDIIRKALSEVNKSATKSPDKFTEESFCYIDEISIAKSIYGNKSLKIILEKLEFSGFRDYSVTFLCNAPSDDEESNVYYEIIQLLASDSYLKSGLDKKDCLMMANNQTTFMEILSGKINALINDLSSIERTCHSAEIEVLGDVRIRVGVNKTEHIDVIRELIEPFTKVSIVNDASDKNIVSIASDEICLMIGYLLDEFEYIYTSKYINHPEVLLSGRGYIFFNIMNRYIIGKHKFSGIRDTDTICYFRDMNRATWYILLSDSYSPSSESIPRIIRTFISYLIREKGGFNLHAASIVVNKCKSIVLIGDKNQGKTTNLITVMSYFPSVDLQSNDYVHAVIVDDEIITLGSNKTIGIRIGTIIMSEELRRIFRDKSEMEKMKLSSRGYGSRYSYNVKNIDEKKFLDNFNIFLTPQELAGVFGKKIIPATPLIGIVKPVFAANINGYRIREMSHTEKLCLIQKNLHDYYNANEPFWNKLLGESELNQCAMRDIARNLPGFEIISNESSIYDAWNELLSNRLRGGEI